MAFLVISAGIFPVGLDIFLPFAGPVGARSGASGVGAGEVKV